MGFDERCAVSAMIAKRNDPMAVLPTELIIEILSHLSIFAPWQLQVIGKRWRSLLSSGKILRASIMRWETHRPSDSARDQLQADGRSVNTKVRHTQALRLGCPFSRAQFSYELPSQHWPPEQIIALKGSRLAYICAPANEGHAVVVKELTSGEVVTLRGDARETISSLALGSDVIAFATHSGKLYTRDLSEPYRPSQVVRLPSAALLAMHVDERIVGVVLNCGKLVSPALANELYGSETRMREIACFVKHDQR